MSNEEYKGYEDEMKEDPFIVCKMVYEPNETSKTITIQKIQKLEPSQINFERDQTLYDEYKIEVKNYLFFKKFAKKTMLICLIVISLSIFDLLFFKTFNYTNRYNYLKLNFIYFFYYIAIKFFKSLLDWRRVKKFILLEKNSSNNFRKIFYFIRLLYYLFIMIWFIFNYFWNNIRILNYSFSLIFLLLNIIYFLFVFTYSLIKETMSYCIFFIINISVINILIYSSIYNINNNKFNYNSILWPIYLYGFIDTFILIVVLVNFTKLFMNFIKFKELVFDLKVTFLILYFLILKISYFVITTLFFNGYSINLMVYFKFFYIIFLIFFMIVNLKIQMIVKPELVERLNIIKQIDDNKNYKYNENSEVNVNIPGVLKKTTQHNFLKLDKLNLKKSFNIPITENRKKNKLNNIISSRGKMGNIETLNNKEKITILEQFNKAKDKKDYNLIIPKKNIKIEKNEKKIIENILETQRNLGKDNCITNEEILEMDDSLCQICYIDKINCILMDCGHGGICITCAKDIWLTCKNCYLCKKPINKLLKTKELTENLVQVVEYYLLNPKYIPFHKIKYKY